MRFFLRQTRATTPYICAKCNSYNYLINFIIIVIIPFQMSILNKNGRHLNYYYIFSWCSSGAFEWTADGGMSVASSLAFRLAFFMAKKELTRRLKGRLSGLYVKLRTPARPHRPQLSGRVRARVFLCALFWRWVWGICPDIFAVSCASIIRDKSYRRLRGCPPAFDMQGSGNFISVIHDNRKFWTVPCSGFGPDCIAYLPHHFLFFNDGEAFAYALFGYF